MWLDFVSVRVHFNRSREVVVDYAMKGVLFDHGEGEGDLPVHEQAPAAKEVEAPPSVVFETELPEAIEAFVAAVLRRSATSMRSW
jgi:hypothetical protein